MKCWVIPLLMMTTVAFAQDRPLGPPKPEKTKQELEKEKTEAEAAEKKAAEKKQKADAAKKLNHAVIKRQCSQSFIAPYPPSIPFIVPSANRHHPDITNIRLPRGMPTMIAAPSERTTRLVIYLVDVSGSMKNEKKLRRAIQSSMMLLTYAVESFQAKFFAFHSSHTIWEGYKEPEPPPGVPVEQPLPGWTMYPSQGAMNAAINWLAGVGAKGSTNPATAFTAALRTEHKKLTIIVISDGGFHLARSRVAIRDGQEWRKKTLGEKAIIGAFGVGTFFDGLDGKGEEDDDLVTLRTIGQMGRGGAWVDRPLTKPDED